MAASVCPTCRTAARLTSGAEVYPARRDLAKAIWKCDVCPDSYVGCHPGSTAPLGVLGRQSDPLGATLVPPQPV
jgi:hypothetical protein